MENKAEISGGAIETAGMGACDTAGGLMPLKEAAPINLSLAPRKPFWEGVQQAEDWAINLAKIKSFW